MRRLTREVIEGIASWAWLDDTGYGPVAFLLLARPEGELEAVADALGLAAPARQLPRIGDRVAVVGATRVALRLDGSRNGMEVTVGERWSRFVAGGGPVVVLVGLAPLARCAGPEEVEAYLGMSAAVGQLRLGVDAGADATA